MTPRIEHLTTSDEATKRRSDVGKSESAPSLRRGPRRSGFALLMVIALIGILAMALVALGLVLSRQAKRTAALRQDVQLRQMLLAGGIAVREKSRGWGEDVAEDRWSIDLPKSLAGEGAILVVRINSSDGPILSAEVEATLGPRRMRQTLKLLRREKQWEVVESRLGE